MSKYRVIQNGYGFQGRYWEIGTVVEIDCSEKPPKYFQLVVDTTDEEKEPEVKQSEDQVHTQLQRRRKKK